MPCLTTGNNYSAKSLWPEQYVWTLTTGDQRMGPLWNVQEEPEYKSADGFSPWCGLLPCTCPQIRPFNSFLCHTYVKNYCPPRRVHNIVTKKTLVLERTLPVFRVSFGGCSVGGTLQPHCWIPLNQTHCTAHRERVKKITDRIMSCHFEITGVET